MMDDIYFKYNYKDVHLSFVSHDNIDSHIAMIETFLNRIERHSNMPEYVGAVCIYLWGELDYLESLKEE